MAREVYRYSVSVPAGTLQAAPQISDLAMPPRVVRRIEVVVPPGPRGELGFRFTSGGVSMIPLNAGAYVVTDDEKLAWDLEGQIDSGAWQVAAYNTGAFNHSIEVRMLVDPVTSPAASTAQLQAAAGFPAPLDPQALGGG